MATQESTSGSTKAAQSAPVSPSRIPVGLGWPSVDRSPFSEQEDCWDSQTHDHSIAAIGCARPGLASGAWTLFNSFSLPTTTWTHQQPQLAQRLFDVVTGFTSGDAPLPGAGQGVGVRIEADIEKRDAVVEAFKVCSNTTP